MLLTGHVGEVFSVKFSPDGSVLASGSMDRTVQLWRTSGDCDNFAMLRGHKNAVLEVQWMGGGEVLLSASPDKTLRAWDVTEGVQIKKLAEHSSFVNSCSVLRRGSPLAVSGSDDCTLKVWDLRVKKSVSTMSAGRQVTAVAFSEAGDQVYSGSITNGIAVWDLRKERTAFTMLGHKDTITGLALSPQGTHLLSNAMDNTLQMWDMRPFAPGNRCIKIFQGHLHNFEKNLLKAAWSPDGTRVTAGSADRVVHVWDVATRTELYRLPGHTGSVNEAVFHPNEPVLASCASDKQIFLGELAD